MRRFFLSRYLNPLKVSLAVRHLQPILWSFFVLVLVGGPAMASEADLAIPDLHVGKFPTLGGMSAWDLLFYGALVISGTLGISLYLRTQIHKLPAHKSMLDVAEIIFQTCKTYLIQQGKFLLMLFVLIAVAITYYLLGFGHARIPGDRSDDSGASPYPAEKDSRRRRRHGTGAADRRSRSTETATRSSRSVKDAADPGPMGRSTAQTITDIAAPVPIGPFLKVLLVLLLLRRRHGRLVLRWPGTASASTPTPTAAPPSPRSRASRGTWSTFRCGRACRSACS